MYKSLWLLFTIALIATTNANILDSFNYNSNGGEYMAIMTSGDVDDFGYNYVINAGRVQMEKDLNISNTLWVPNIKNNVSAIAKGIELVQRNFRVIISGTFSHGNAMTVLATTYPNITFAAYTSTRSTLPNLSTASWLNPEFWFAIGAFAGITSLNDRVGFIHPGPVTGSIQSINAFYAGVKYVNASVSVYTMYSGDYIAVDRAQGAADYLVNEIGVGALTGQQDDLTVPRAAMNAGLLAIGVTGFSLRTLFGELVGVSFVRDWAPILATYAAGVNGVVIKQHIASSFDTHGQFPDTKSYLVTDAQWEVLMNAIKAINNTRTYTCGPMLSKFITSGSCINNTLFNTQVYPDINDLGFYTIPLTDFPFPESSRIGIIVVSAILLMIPVTLAILVVVLRHNKEIQAGSPFFFLVMLLGCALVYIGAIIWPIEPSKNLCYARIWLPSLGATIAIAALITKNIRIFLLFFNPFRFRGEKLKIKYYMPLVLIMVLIDVIILIVYTTVGPEGVHVQQGTHGLGAYETRHVCANSDEGNAIVYTILVWHFIQLIIGCVVSFMLRNVTEKQYNERKSVAMAIYVITFCLIISAALLGATDISNHQLIIFVVVALLISNTGVLALIFGSRFVNMIVDPPEPTRQSANKSSGASKGSGNSRGTSGGSDGDSQSAVHSSRPPAVVFAV